MKPSKYNHFCSFTSEQSIAYNARSGALALIDNNKLKMYTEFVNAGKEIEDKELEQDLLHGSFLVEDSIDELDIIRHNMLRGRYATNVLTLTIAPTSDCNFRCVYCYQKSVLNCEYMSESVQDAIINLVDSMKSHLQAVSVTWYGGEPLLALPIIQKISTELIKICDVNHISYTANMITNGYLLSRSTLEVLKGIRIQFLQITLDGGPKQHNAKRPLSNGDESFWVILNNLRNGYDLLPQVSLRINLDCNNLSAGDEVKQYITEYGIIDKVVPYYGRIRNDNECYDDDKCLSACEFAEIEYDFALEVNSSAFRKPVRLPNSRTSFCGADRVYSFVISANGLLYKCWSDIGNLSRSVGNILNSANDINSTYLEYLLFDPTQIAPCKDCNILPICMGGCPFQRILSGKQECTKYKFILNRYLGDITRRLLCARHIEQSSI